MEGVLIEFNGKSLDFTSVILIKTINRDLVVICSHQVEIKFGYSNNEEAEKARMKLTGIINKSYK